jgi:hypothetical protein
MTRIQVKQKKQNSKYQNTNKIEISNNEKGVWIPVHSLRSIYIHFGQDLRFATGFCVRWKDRLILETGSRFSTGWRLGIGFA